MEKGEAMSLWFLGYLNTQIKVYHSEVQSRVIFVVKEIHKNCTENVLSPKFVRVLLWGVWADINDEEQVGNLTHCFFLQGVILQFLSDTYSVSLHFSGTFCFSATAGKQFVISECNRTIAFLLLEEKVRSCWVLHPFGWESRFSGKAAEQYSCPW